MVAVVPTKSYMVGACFTSTQAWRAYTDRNLITSRNVGSYHDTFLSWLKDSEFKDKTWARLFAERG